MYLFHYILVNVKLDLVFEFNFEFTFYKQN